MREPLYPLLRFFNFEELHDCTASHDIFSRVNWLILRTKLPDVFSWTGYGGPAPIAIVVDIRQRLTTYVNYYVNFYGS